MKLADAQVDVQSNMTFDETINMNIDDAAIPMVLKSLITMYSNPYRAALREYTSNAWDAHKAHNVQRPVEVNLPDRLAPNLSVRDFGVGLSRDELKGFGQFGTSSKRDSNEYTGGFGLGSKSGLAVSSQFTVSSIKNGRRNTIIIARDEANRPVMNFLAEAETDEPSGTTITIPVANVELFGDLEDFFVGWAPGSVLVNDEEPKRSVHATDQFQVMGDNFGWYDKSNTPSGRDHLRVMINQVYYLLEYKKLGVSYKEHNILKYMILKLDNGSVEIAPNREDLIYNARTKAAISARVQQVLGMALRRRLEDVKKATTLREALNAIENLRSEGFPTKDIKFRGKRIALPGREVNGHKVPDPVVTWADPEGDHRSSTGWRINKSFRTLSYQSPWKFPVHKKLVIIHSASAPEIQAGTGREFHREVLGLADWIVAQPNGHEAYHWEIAITDLPLEKINPVYRELAHIIVPVDVVNAAAKAARAARAEEAKKNRVVKVKSSKLKVLLGTYSGRADISEMTVEEITKNYSKVAILRNLSGGLHEAVRDIYTTKRYYTSYRYVPIRNIVAEKKIAMILVGKNEKMDDFLPHLPPVTTLSEEVAQVVRDSFSVPSMIERVAMHDRDDRNIRSFINMDSVYVKQIKRTETRAWVQAMKDYRDTGMDLRRSLEWTKGYGDDRNISKAFSAGVQANLPPLEESPLKRYPLIQHLSSYNTPGRKLVDYINLCDAKLDKKTKKIKRLKLKVAA